MSKRFIDTGLFDDDWFMELSKDAKILWLYSITKCNHAGILKINEKLCKVQTDIKELDKIIKELTNRLIRVNDHIYFIPKFIEFQYPGFPNSKVRAQNSAIEILKKYNLFEDNKLTVSEGLINSYEHEHEHGYGSDHGSELENEKSEFDIFRKEYPGTKKGNDTEFSNFIKKHKDWRDILPKLIERLNYQKEARQVRLENKLFVPGWKNLQTWINQRGWEDQINTNE